MNGLALFVVGTMVGCFAALVVLSIFYVGGRREKKIWSRDDQLLRSIVSKQDKLIETLEKSVELGATCYLGKFDDCRTCCFVYTCKVCNQDDVDACIETVMEGWKDEARRIMQ